jgi:uncharacterized protein (TIGR02996 family)
MTRAHAFLRAAWESGEVVHLLVYADWLDEQGDTDTAELLRLTVEEASTARYCKERTRRLKQLRDKVLEGLKAVHRLVVNVEGRQDVVRNNAGQELLRRLLPRRLLQGIREKRFGPWEAWWQRTLSFESFDTLPRPQMEELLAGAAVPLSDLPTELAPYVCCLLCEHAAQGIRSLGKYSRLPVGRIKYVPYADAAVVRSIRRGVLFLMAFWSVPSVQAFAKLTEVLVRLDAGGLELVVANVDGSPGLYELPEFKGIVAGAGETAWVREGKIVATSGLGLNTGCFEPNTRALLSLP